MTLKELIKRGKLEEFGEVSLMQVTNKLKFAFKNLNTAENLFKAQGGDEDINRIIYLNTYNAVRLALQAYVLSEGYRTKGQGHHKTLIIVTKLLIKDDSLDSIFTSMLKMSKNRNKIDYDVEILDVSNKTMNKSLKDARTLLNKINRKVEAKSPQTKLDL